MIYFLIIKSVNSGVSSILEKCGITQTSSTVEKPIELKISEANPIEQSLNINKQLDIGLANIIEDVIAPTKELHYLPYELRKPRKKKGKPNQ